MRKLQVLHLASFEGNVGDNANHSGVRKLLGQHLDFTLVYTQLEIREFYWRQRTFDEDFIRYANGFDLLMIGGGNYFEFWVEHSATGTSIDIAPHLLKKLKVPVFFNALGADPAQGFSDNTVTRFRHFLDELLASDQFLVSVRNDGSRSALAEYVGHVYAKHIVEVPDGGFFAESGAYWHPELPNTENDTVIAINLAGDMPDVRYGEQARDRKTLSYHEFIERFAALLTNILQAENHRHIVFVPHIYKDIGKIADVLAHMPDHLRRKHITIAPYLHGPGAELYLLSLYKQSDIVLGNRLHANVCNIGQHTPTIGLHNYRQIACLYDNLDLSERVVRVNEQGFESLLLPLIENTLSNTGLIKKNYSDITGTLYEKIRYFHKDVNQWLLANAN